MGRSAILQFSCKQKRPGDFSPGRNLLTLFGQNRPTIAGTYPSAELSAESLTSVRDQNGGIRISDFQEILAENDRTVVPASSHCVGPHLIRDLRIVGRHKVRQHERFHPRLRGHAPHFLGRRVMAEN
jgi:hypothetical protein